MSHLKLKNLEKSLCISLLSMDFKDYNIFGAKYLFKKFNIHPAFQHLCQSLKFVPND